MPKKKMTGQVIRRPINMQTNVDPALKFRIEEAYKSIRTNLVFSIMKQGCKKIVFTSSRPSEGKTSTAVHLGITLASADYKVLLIDSDLRKPKAHHYFEMHVAPGLTNFLGSMVDKGSTMSLNSVVQKTNYPNLYLLPAGSCPPNPAELLASEPMSMLLKELESQFDYILMDTPPINVVSDGLPLIKQSDGVVAIVRANSSTYPEVDKMVQSLEFIEANVLGMVLTAVETDTKSKGYDDYGYYSYGTGRSRSRSATDRETAQPQQARRTAERPSSNQRPPAKRPTAGQSNLRPGTTVQSPVQPTMQSGQSAIDSVNNNQTNGIPPINTSSSESTMNTYVDISSFDVPPRK